MTINRVWVVIGLVLVGSITVWAQTPASYQIQIANSDVILCGTVTAIRDITPPGGSRTTGLIIERTIEEVTLQPVQLLKGTVPAGPVTVRFFIYQFSKQYQLPKVGDQQVYFLERAKDAMYTAWPSGVLGIGTLDDIAGQVKTSPLSVTLSTPTPLYFREATTIIITLVNNTARPMTISNCYVHGFYYAQHMESDLQASLSAFKDQPYQPVQTICLGKTVPLAANSKLTLPLYVATIAPPTMALFGADSFLLTDATLHVNVDYSQEKDQLVSMRSNWVDCLIGYPCRIDKLATAA